MNRVERLGLLLLRGPYMSDVRLRLSRGDGASEGICTLTLDAPTLSLMHKKRIFKREQVARGSRRTI